jgi:O-antigen/teichoic acid export membrane protein
MHKKIQSWRQDPLLRNVIRSSGYLFSSNTLMAAMSMLQGILIVRLIGIEGLGVITIVTTFASNVHRLLSFRMSEVVVRFLGTALERNESVRAAGIFRWSVLIEASTSLIAFLILILLSPWAVTIFKINPDFGYLIVLYGTVLLGNLIFESSSGTLQCLRRFDLLAKINVGQSLLTAGLILVAFITHSGTVMVVLAYLAGKLFSGLAVSLFAWKELSRILGKGWWRLPFEMSGEVRRLLRFAINTNLHGTVNLMVRDNIPLLLGALRNQVEVGYFKLALSIINLVMLPIEPLIWPTYAEITRSIASRHWRSTRQLLKRVSTIAGVWTVTAGGMIALLGPWLIPLAYNPESSPAYPAVLLLMIGYGFANIFNWNRPLLLALGKPGFPLAVTALVGVIEIGLTVLLVPKHGYLMQSAILSGFFVLSVGIILWRGMAEVKFQERFDRQSQNLGSAI